MRRKIRNLAVAGALALSGVAVVTAGSNTASAINYPVCQKYITSTTQIERCTYSYPYYAHRSYAVCKLWYGEVYAADYGPWVSSGYSSGSRCPSGYLYHHGWAEQARY